MVKSYLRYEAEHTFGLVCSPGPNHVALSSSGGLLLTAGLERLLVFHARQGTLLRSLALPESSSRAPTDSAAPAISCIAACPTHPHRAAVGYANGLIAVWDVEQGVCRHQLASSDAAVSSLRYSASGLILGAGHADGHFVAWDDAGELPLCRFRGHKHQVSDFAFIESSNLGSASLLRPAGNSSRPVAVVTVSKDSQMRLWDIATSVCLQVLLLRSPLSSVDMCPGSSTLAGGGDAGVVIYRATAASAQVGSSPAGPAAARLEGAADDGPGRPAGVPGEGGAGAWEVRLEALGPLPRAQEERVQSLRFGRRGSVLACQGPSRAVELFRVLPTPEALRKAKQRRRRKRARKEANGAGAEGEQGDGARGTGGEGQEGGARGTENEIEAVDMFRPLDPIRCKSRVCSLAFSDPMGAAEAGGAVKGSDGTRGAGGSPGGGSRRGQSGACLLALALQNNSVDMFALSTGDAPKPSPLASFTQEGQRSAVRALAVSSDAALLLSLSDSSAKLWSLQSSACLATMDSGYGLCGLFVPGNQFAVAGTKGGSLDVFSLASAERVEEVASAHAGAVWGMAPLPDGSGFVTGGADGYLRFWEYQLVAVGSPGGSQEEGREGDGDEGDGLPVAQQRVLRVVVRRSLKVGEDVLAVSVSPDGKHVAAALLDSTLKVYFADTLKFYLSLYGHKLPVLCCDVSSDSTLLVSGSADKSVKIWGLDFGDCHRSLFAHQDSVTQVRFVPRTHYFFSAGKDKVIKYWDADRFQELLVLRGHHAEVWALGMSPSRGDCVVSGSNDRSLRVWRRTDEPLFVEDERERQMEAMLEATPAVAPGAVGMGEDEEGAEGGGEGEGRAGEGALDERSRAAPRRDALWAGDRLLEAIEVASAELQGPNDPGLRASENPLLLFLPPAAYVLRAAGQVRSSELEDALLVLPFSAALKLLKFCATWLRGAHSDSPAGPHTSAGTSRAGKGTVGSNGSLWRLGHSSGEMPQSWVLPPEDVELASRVAVGLLRTHHRQIMGTPGVGQLLLGLQAAMQRNLRAAVTMVGCNLAAMEHLRARHAAQAQTLSDSRLGLKVREVRAQLALPPEARAAQRLAGKRKRKKAARTKRSAEAAKG